MTALDPTAWARGHEAGVAQENAVQYEVRNYVADQLDELAARRCPPPDDAAELTKLAKTLRRVGVRGRKGQSSDRS